MLGRHLYGPASPKVRFCLLVSYWLALAETFYPNHYCKATYRGGLSRLAWCNRCGPPREQTGGDFGRR